MRCLHALAIASTSCLFACSTTLPSSKGTTEYFESRGPDAVTEQAGGFVLTSPAFSQDGALPRVYTRDRGGEDRPPPLAWATVPRGTKSLVMICADEDASRGFAHWVLFDIPANARSIAEGQTYGRQGKNDLGRLGWAGPLPPYGAGAHHYVFRLFALDTPTLGLPEGASPNEVVRAMDGHVLDSTQAVATYRRAE